MSASPVARSVTQSQSIPTRHVIINSASQLPNDYSSTPGGTLYSCTPGGTRIVYERNFLLQMRNSPMSKTPPKNIHYIPGFSPNKVMNENNNTHKLAQRQNSPDKMRVSPTIAQNAKEVEHGEQFEMDL